VVIPLHDNPTTTKPYAPSVDDHARWWPCSAPAADPDQYTVKLIYALA
jgi:hypothetical protein